MGRRKPSVKSSVRELSQVKLGGDRVTCSSAKTRYDLTSELGKKMPDSDPRSSPKVLEVGRIAKNDRFTVSEKGNSALLRLNS